MAKWGQVSVVEALEEEDLAEEASAAAEEVALVAVVLPTENFVAFMLSILSHFCIIIGM